ncbi:MAG: hypothetical protein IJZ51_07445 [Ruminiclostridium sp.]|nr:hypothetical protein [Ruminiclostridium sp.]
MVENYIEDFYTVSYNGKKAFKSLDEYRRWYFGADECEIRICVHRAYRDFCRLLRGIAQNSDKQKWREAVEKYIDKRIKELLSKTDTDKDNFDIWHKETCEGILKFSNNSVFRNIPLETYGLAQKWLNMTLKYMIIMGKWEKDMKAIIPFLHVPVDSYIMEAASTELGIMLYTKNHEPQPYNKNQSMLWSKWKKYDVYNYFQEQIAIKLREKNITPIDWEGPAWIKIAKKRKK